jgi:four helix bundle protein
MHDVRRLQVWQSSRELVVALQPFLHRFPRNDHGVLCAQLRRATLSIPSCIAEGCGAGSRAETVRYLKMASRSACEAESHLQLAHDLHYIPPKPAEQLLAQIQSIQRMLARLIQKIPG